MPRRRLLWCRSDWDPLGAAGSGAALGVFFLSTAMAADSITFDATALVKGLDVFAKVQLPYLAAVTVNRTAEAVKKALRSEMYDSFTYVSRFTANSLEQTHFATKAQPWTEVGIKEYAGKGNAAAKYLAPQITGGLVFQTRFQWRLKSKVDGYNGRYMLPLHNSPAAELGETGRIRASQYVKALYGIKAMEDIRANATTDKYRTSGDYVYVPYVGANKTQQKYFRALGKGRIPNPGIHRIKATNLVQLFKQLDQVPMVEKRYDFVYTAELATTNNVQKIFNAEFLKTIGRPNA